MTRQFDSTPRAEHPRPQFRRDDWLCLNGEWQFERDRGDSGLERGLLDRDLAESITIPFCPESELSGIGDTDFLNAVWYRRELVVPEAWTGRRVWLHFQAVDYDATVWLDGQELGRHRGGWTPFSFDITGRVEPGKSHTLVVRARDDHRQAKPMGKQSAQYANRGCHYTRTTGIWQTVWLEAVGEKAWLDRARIVPDLAGGRFAVTQPIRGDAGGMTVRATLTDPDGEVSRASLPADADFSPLLMLEIPEDKRRVWSLDDPFLYGLELELIAPEGTVIDAVSSYAGLRSVRFDGMAFTLNGQTVFQRLVLDQGYYPDGILTAPTDEALVRDIELSKRAGFNGARLHEKVFEERFLYHADRLGYLVWAEFGDWGVDEQRSPSTYVTQWLEAIRRDLSHPSIVGWCGLNETHTPCDDHIHPHDDTVRGMFLAARTADPTRPVLDTSGYTHRVAETDVYDSHDYDQDPTSFATNHAGLADGEPFVNGVGSKRTVSIPYGGQPYFVSEFGGIWWNPKAEGGDSWGYGDRPASEEEFHERFEKLVTVLLDNKHMFGYCYTQLTDVFQETNGIYAFDRSDKLDVERVGRAQRRPAAIEQAR